MKLKYVVPAALAVAIVAAFGIFFWTSQSGNTGEHHEGTITFDGGTVEWSDRKIYVTVDENASTGFVWYASIDNVFASKTGDALDESDSSKHTFTFTGWSVGEENATLNLRKGDEGEIGESMVLFFDLGPNGFLKDVKVAAFSTTENGVAKSTEVASITDGVPSTYTPPTEPEEE